MLFIEFKRGEFACGRSANYGYGSHFCYFFFHKKKNEEKKIKIRGKETRQMNVWPFKPPTRPIALLWMKP